MAGKQVTELEKLTEFNDDCIAPIHNGVGLKKGTIGDLSEYLGTKFSNPNLLINPDFLINQRRQSTYTSTSSSVYSVDRWKIFNCTLSKLDDGVKVENKSSSIGIVQQELESNIDTLCMISCYVTSVSGRVVLHGTNNTDSVTLKNGENKVLVSNCKGVTFDIGAGASLVLNWVKLENGNLATPFVKPDINLEYAKCQRLYCRYNIDSKVVTYLDYNIYIYLDKVYMRTSPTATLTNNSGAKAINLAKIGNITSINTVESGNDRGGQHVKINTNANNTNSIFITDINGTHWLELDAEIY